MSLKAKVANELKAIGATTLFFAIWFCTLMLLKKLILEEYHIQFGTLSVAFIGALIVAKVVLVMENIPLGPWLRRQSGLIHITTRTAMYALGVVVILLLEKAFEGRHEYGGFFASLGQIMHHADIHHVWATAIGVTGALLVFNAMFVIRRHVGEHALWRIFLSPVPEETPVQRQTAENSVSG